MISTSSACIRSVPGKGHRLYGWGLYFASNKKVAEWYRDRLGKIKYLIDGKPAEEWGRNAREWDIAVMLEALADNGGYGSLWYNGKLVSIKNLARDDAEAITAKGIAALKVINERGVDRAIEKHQGTAIAKWLKDNQDKIEYVDEDRLSMA